MQLIRQHLWLILIAVHLLGLSAIMSSALRADGDRPQQLAGPATGDGFLLADADHRPAPRLADAILRVRLAHAGHHVTIIITRAHRAAPARGPV
jgi:hypothetical protein